MVAESGLVFELALEAEGDAESEPVNTAGAEAEDGAGGKTGAEVDVVPDPRSVAEFGLVASGFEMYHSLLSGAVAVLNSEVVTESRVEFVFVAASGLDYMVAPFEDTRGTFAVA